MKNLHTSAKRLLLNTRKAPGTYALTKESFVNRVATILEMLFTTKEFSTQSFYAKHLVLKGNTYLSSNELPDEAWGHVVVDDALSIMNKHSNKEDDGLLQEGDKFRFINLPKSGHHLIGRFVHNDQNLRPIVDMQDLRSEAEACREP